MAELAAFDANLAQRPMIVGISKLDLPEAQEVAAATRAELESRGLEVFEFSAATGEGVEAVLVRLESLLREHPVNKLPPKRFLNAAERPAGHGDGRPAQPGDDV